MESDICDLHERRGQTERGRQVSNRLRCNDSQPSNAPLLQASFDGICIRHDLLRACVVLELLKLREQLHLLSQRLEYFINVQSVPRQYLTPHLLR